MDPSLIGVNIGFGKRQIVFKKRCCHKWVTVSDTVLSSALQDLLEAGLKNIKANYSDEFLVKVHVVVLKCTVCGEVRKLVTRSMD